MTRENFNKLSNIFPKPEKGSPLEQDFKAMETGMLHNGAMFDEEGDAHGGEKVNAGTGKPNINSEITKTHDLNEREEIGSNDVMGDIKDPSNMTLEQLLASENDLE